MFFFSCGQTLGTGFRRKRRENERGRVKVSEISSSSLSPLFIIIFIIFLSGSLFPRVPFNLGSLFPLFQSQMGGFTLQEEIFLGQVQRRPRNLYQKVSIPLKFYLVSKFDFCGYGISSVTDDPMWPAWHTLCLPRVNCFP